MAKVSLLPLCLLLTLLAAAPPLCARDGDKDLPISVEADSLELRERENISIYEGNVSLRQGSLEIEADRLVIHFDDDGELRLMEMTGAPARLRRLDNDDREMRGQARRINYRESESLLELREEARFKHAGDTIESSVIRINTEDNSIQAGTSNSDERVKMLIRPRRGVDDPQ